MKTNYLEGISLLLVCRAGFWDLKKFNERNVIVIEDEVLESRTRKRFNYERNITITVLSCCGLEDSISSRPSKE